MGAPRKHNADVVVDAVPGSVVVGRSPTVAATVATGNDLLASKVDV